jgi:hypothetical protein
LSGILQQQVNSSWGRKPVAETGNQPTTCLLGRHSRLLLAGGKRDKNPTIAGCPQPDQRDRIFSKLLHRSSFFLLLSYYELLAPPSFLSAFYPFQMIISDAAGFRIDEAL